MIKVKIEVRHSDGKQNRVLQFSRVPSLRELITLDDNEVFTVKEVLHYPANQMNDYDALIVVS